jgi:hypothetical protein
LLGLFFNADDGGDMFLVHLIFNWSYGTLS